MVKAMLIASNGLIKILLCYNKKAELEGIV